MQKKLLSTGPFLIAIAAILWAFDGVLRRSLFVLPPIVIVFAEHLVGTILLLPVAIRQFVVLKGLRPKEWGLIIWIALFSGVLGTLWFTTALLKVGFIPFSVVFLLQKLQPVFVIIAAAIFLKERITAAYLRLALVALIAAYFVTFPNGVVNLTTGAGTLTAALYALAAAFAWGTSTVFSRMLLTKVPDSVSTFVRFAFATVIAGFGVMIAGTQESFFSITTTQWSTLLLIALSTGMVALYLYYRGLSRTPARVATLLELLFPVTAVFIDVVLYKTTLVPSQYLAAVVLLAVSYRLGSMKQELPTISTTQIRGKGRGKFLGFPTVNMKIPRKLSIQDGIYAVWVMIGTKRYKGALHYGPVPTFGDKKKTLEVFLLDTKDLPRSYKEGDTITVVFREWLRPVILYPSEAALVEQIGRDVASVRAVLSDDK